MIKYSTLLPNIDKTPSNIAVFDTLQKYENDFLSYLKLKLKNWISKKFVDPKDFIDYCYQFGFDVTYLNGYTATIKYLEKEKNTLIQRIRARSTPHSYQYIYYIFNLIGQVYVLQKTTEEDLAPIKDFLLFPGFINEKQTLDRDEDEFGLPTGETVQTLDEGVDVIDFYLPRRLDQGSRLDLGNTLDDPESLPNNITPPTEPEWTLDKDDIYGSITRHILLTFKIQFKESSILQISNSTWLALHNDVIQNKRRIEIPHYELIIPLNGLKTTGLVFSESYYAEEKNIVGMLESITLNTLTSAKTLQLGSGEYTGNLNLLTSSSFPINSPVKTFNIPDQNVETISSYQLIFRNFIYPNTRIFKNIDNIQYFSEVAIRNNLNELIYYARFPRIEMNPIVFNTLGFEINLRD